MVRGNETPGQLSCHEFPFKWLVIEPIDNRTKILYNKGMTLWQELQSALLADARRPLSEQAGGLLRDVERLAASEGRSPDELLLSLLDQGLQERQDDLRARQGWKLLSLREQQVAALICQGFTSRQIAARLVLSPETIKTHVRHILRKFGLRTRRELRQALENWSFGQILASIGDTALSVH